MKMKKIWTTIVLCGMCGVAFASAHKAEKQPRPTPPDIALNAYIERVRAESAAEEHSPGAIWTPDGRLARLSADVRASNASSQVSALFGKLSASNALNNLVNQTSASGLNAQGESVTNSSLSTTLGGEVVDVLPNGMLVIQAVRQATFNQQTQLIRLRGLVRPEDGDAQNQVLSTAISSLEVEVVGKGIINDYTYRPNAVVRFLQKLLIF